MNNNTSREAFESSPICAGANFAMTNGVYVNPTVNRMWMGWQASRKALEVEQAQAVEPVAWTLTETLDKRVTTTSGYLWFSDPVNCCWTPLYTHPAAPLAQQVAVPEPMSGYEIAKWWASENGLEDCDMCIHGDFAEVVRAVEARHKIGTKP